MRRGKMWMSRSRVLALCCGLVLPLVAPVSARAAYNLTISSNPSVNAGCSGGICQPTGSGANLSVSDLTTALSAGDVTVTTGSGGTDPGTITIAPLGSVSSSSPNTLTFEPATSVIIDGETLTTAGGEVYEGPVAIDGDTTLASSGSGSIQFDSTIDGPHSLSVNTAGTVMFDGSIGAAAPLASLAMGGAGPITLGSGVSQLNTSGAQDFGGPLTLDGNPTLASNGSGSIQFSSTIGGAQNLAVNTAGTITFDGNLGSGTPLASLMMDGSGPITLGSAVTEVSTSGAQAFGGPLTLDAPNTTVSATDGTVIFASTVDGDSSLNVVGNPIAFTGSVGHSIPLASLVVTNTGNAPTTLPGAVATTGSQMFATPIQLEAPTTLTSEDGQAITFTNSITGNQGLSISTGGAVSLDGPVGTSATPLTNLAIPSAGSISLDGGSVTTSAGQTYGGPVAVGADLALTSNSGPISFGQTVEGPRALTVNTAGTTSFAGDVGHGTPLRNLTVQGPGATTINGTVWGAELIKQGAGTLTLSDANNPYSGGTTVDGGLVNFASGGLGTGPITLDGGGLQWASGNTSDISGALEPIGAGGATFDTNGNPVTLASPISGSGGVTKAGVGPLTLSAANRYSGQTIVQGGALTVSGTVAGPVAVQSGAALICAGGTLSGGVTRDGGTAHGAPDAPEAVTASPQNGSATVSFTDAANCYPVSYTATASPGGATASGAASPITVAGLTGGTAYAFTVTATNPIGSSAPSAASSPVTPSADPPSISIASPVTGSRYTLGQVAIASYSCQDGMNGPGLASCAGSVPSGVALDTSTAGAHSFSVTAVSQDGERVTDRVSYTVVTPSNRFSVASLKRSPSGTITFTLKLPGPGTVQLIETASGERLSRLRLAIGQKGAHKVRLKPNKGLAALITRYGSKLVIRLSITYTPRHGSPRTESRTIHLK